MAIHDCTNCGQLCDCGGYDDCDTCSDCTCDERRYEDPDYYTDDLGDVDDYAYDQGDDDLDYLDYD